MKTSLARSLPPAAPRAAALGSRPGGLRAPALDTGARRDRFERGGTSAWVASSGVAHLGRPSIAARSTPAMAARALAQPAYVPTLSAGTFHPELADDTLLAALRETYAPTHHLDYDAARKHLFSFVHNADGHVVCVYTHRDVATSTIPPADHGARMNTEHTFPKSWLAGKKAAVSDLHHLFPTDTTANEKRSSYPFGVVVGAPSWHDPQSHARLGPDAHGHTVFEPPDAHKGNAARAMFYVAAIYDLHISPAQEAVLRQWSEADPVDDAERTANARIAAVQGNSNPFVDAPEMVARIGDF